MSSGSRNVGLIVAGVESQFTTALESNPDFWTGGIYGAVGRLTPVFHGREARHVTRSVAVIWFQASTRSIPFRLSKMGFTLSQIETELLRYSVWRAVVDFLH